MPLRQTRLVETSERIEAALARVRADLEIEVAFPAEVEAEAEAAAAGVTLPDADATEIPLLTIDPEGSRDLDQAMHIDRDGDGFMVHYAIADLAAVVTPGGAIDREAHRRGQTMYAPDVSAPLHPRVLSEGAASLLPDQVRSAYLWRLRLHADGSVAETTLQRARVRSRAQLTYAQAQQRVVDGAGWLPLLERVGTLRIAQEAARGGASLELPEEEVVLGPNGWHIERRRLLAVEQWNAQISLMTGMAAARLQLSAGRGILRTMPRPSAAAMARFHAESTALGIAWLPEEAYGQYLRRLPRDSAVTVAILTAARRLFRGAGYLILDGQQQADEADVVQAALAAPYAHTTAPLRRLVDRYVLAHCEAIANGRAVPEWATAGLADLPAIMSASGAKASALERTSIGVVAAAVLQPRAGSEFDAVIIERGEDRVRIELIDPPIEASVAATADSGAGRAGERIRVRLVSVDEHDGALRFEAIS